MKVLFVIQNSPTFEAIINKDDQIVCSAEVRELHLNDCANSIVNDLVDQKVDGNIACNIADEFRRTVNKYMMIEVLREHIRIPAVTDR